MSITLPDPIARYFAATNLHDKEAMSAPFAATAVVQDEARERQGAAAIREWIEETVEKYRHTVSVLAVEETDGKVVVTGRVSGAFPGSPVDLRHAFTLAGGKISRLEIRA